MNVRPTPGGLRGRHDLGCSYAVRARTSRHDELVNLIVNAALSADQAAFHVAGEWRVASGEERLPEDSASESRPGDVTGAPLPT
jgi:hypothetical protein